jgi:phosphoglycolate phosphatase-like HAD superfamily hydrolase
MRAVFLCSCCVMKTLFVFDWNGTILADTAPSWRAGNECLEFYGAKPISLKTHRETFFFPILPFYELHGVSAEEVLARRDEGNAVFQNAYEHMAANARTRQGARDLLAHLKAQGAECIILSNYRTDKIAEHLERLDIERYFSHVSAHDCDGTTILQSTTKVLRLKNYMEEYGYAPHETVIIGDTMEEPEIGRELGVTSIGITDGYISRKRLREAAPDYIIHRLCEIKTLGLTKA